MGRPKRFRPAWTSGFYAEYKVVAMSGLSGITRLHMMVKQNPEAFEDVPRDARGHWHPDVLDVIRRLRHKPTYQEPEVLEAVMEEWDDTTRYYAHERRRPGRDEQVGGTAGS